MEWNFSIIKMLHYEQSPKTKKPMHRYSIVYWQQTKCTGFFLSIEELYITFMLEISIYQHQDKQFPFQRHINCLIKTRVKDMPISLVDESSANCVGIDSRQKWHSLHLLICMIRWHVHSNLTKILSGYLILFSAVTGWGFFPIFRWI